MFYLDIKSFFDAVSHEWLVKFIEHRIADRRVVRLIQKTVEVARVGGWKANSRGGRDATACGRLLHYIFDLWV